MFQRIRCWSPDRAQAVLNPDADSVDDATFLFVHSDREVTRRLGTGEERWDTWRLLHAVLEPELPHVIAVITGKSGAGKSHLIHWLSLHIEETATRRVVVVPRAGVTLRGVIERLIAILPDDDQREYRKRLDEAGFEQASAAEKRDRLLYEIGSAVRSLEPDSQNRDIAGLQRDLAGRLPDFLTDSSYKQLLLVEGGILDRLVQRIGETRRSIDESEGRIEFGLADLRLNALNISDLSSQAKQTFQILSKGSAYHDVALDLINRALSPAIGRLLNFTGDQLLDLMLDIRRSLKRRGQHLVLLIEDFARARGIDNALVDALEDQADDEICELRSVIAMTDGYFEKLPDTFQTRVTFRFDIDGSPLVGDDFPERLTRFAARYLNAARFEKDEIDAWDRRYREDRTLERPRFCDGCDYRESCHGAFGHVDGVGLYPFSPTAIQATARLQDISDDETFNPRHYMNAILRPTLTEYANMIREGHFPSGEYLKAMGNHRFTVADEQRIRRTGDDRTVALLALWGNLDRPVAIAPEIAMAFNVEVVSLGDTPPASAIPVRPAGVEAGPTRTDADLAAIDEWVRGGTLNETVMDTLRGLVFDALDSYVDWDAEGLQKSAVSSRTGSIATFRRSGIGFVRQQTTFQARGVRLILPPEESTQDDLRRTAMAFGGLIRAKQSGGWGFDQAADHWAALRVCLDEWRTIVLDQIQTLGGAVANWRPASTALELLLIGAALSKGPVNSHSDDRTIVAAILEPGPREASLHDPRLAATYRRIVDLREVLQELVRRSMFGPKGGATSFLNTSLVIGEARRFLRDWRLSDVPGDALTRADDLGRLANLAKRVTDEIALYGVKEVGYRREWYRLIRSSVPDGDFGPFKAQAKRLIKAVRESGLAVRGPTLDKADAATTNLTSLSVIKDTFGDIAAEEDLDPFALLPRLRAGQVAAMASARAAIAEVGRLLDEAENALSSERTRIQDAGADEVGDRIAAELRRCADLNVLVEEWR